MYKVIHYFHDREDERRPYTVGDVFPYRGKVSKKRLEELSTDKNRQKKPLIEFVDVNKLTKKEVQQLLEQKEIPFEEKETKKELIEKLGE